jgi:hypothetical protein
MASMEHRSDPVCTICLEVPEVLKVVTTCKHAFCRKCLSSHIESIGQASRSFPCPTCSVECPLSGNGVDGLMDYDDAEAVGGGLITGENVGCSSCRRTKDTIVDAENLCQECGNVYLCKDCTVIHGRNRATSDHVVISLKALNTKIGGNCRNHGELISRYCCTCSKPCCFICVLHEHGDHDVKRIGHVFCSLVQEVGYVADDYERKSNHLKRAELELKVLRDSEVSVRKATLIREIEEHAEITIERILEQKNAMKEKVQREYKVVSEVYDWLGKVPSLAKIEKSISQARAILPEVEPHPYDIKRLSEIKRRIESGNFTDDIDVGRYWKFYQQLFDKPFHFVPSEKEYTFGKLEVKENVYNDFSKCKLLFEKELPVDDKEFKYIPSVANLGNDFYAVAHPSVHGKSSNAIDIYKIPGEFQQTFTDNVAPICDMASTPDGKLAVLSEGCTGGSCHVRLFDPDDGYIRSTKDFHVCGPLSFDINMRHQYVVLSDDGVRRVSIHNDDGSSEFVQDIDKSYDVSDAHKITCLANDSFVLIGMANLVIFKLKDRKMCEIINCREIFTSGQKLIDISATAFGEINLSYKMDNEYKLRKTFLRSDHLPNWHFYTMYKQRGAKTRARLSARNNYIVVSMNHTIQVYKEG